MSQDATSGAPTSNPEDPVLETRHDTTLVLTLNAPDRRNALSTAMRLRLREALDAACRDRTLRAIVLTGAAGTFSAGGDIREMGEPGEPIDSVRTRERLGMLHDCVRLLAAGPKPVIAAVEGTAYGAGLSLALACDAIVAAEGARFCASFGRIGLAPDCGLLWTLPQRVGVPRARKMMMTAEEVDLDRAEAIGLVDRRAARGAALETALDEALQWTRIGPLAAASIRRQLALAPSNLDAALSLEMESQIVLMGSRDHAAAREAFVARRGVVFEGR